MQRVYNFSAGPAMLPDNVLKIAQAQMLNWDGSGMSVMEISHRSAAFEALLADTKQRLRELMSIPNNYHILFMASGARGQFAAVPMNLLADNAVANYAVTGSWSNLAAEEAQKYGEIKSVINADVVNMTEIPAEEKWQVDADARYFYYTPNETLLGVEFPFVPEVPMPIVADMTSCILSRDYDVSKFGLIYASAQKNLGQAGVTLVIVRDDLVTTPQACTPEVFSYQTFVKNGSLHNTPPTYAIYIMNLMLQDLQARGGVSAIEKMNQQKSNLLYDAIDRSEFYHNQVVPKYRSAVNVTFNLPSEELEKRFVAAAQQQDLVGLKGHSAVGGVRASLYNAMPIFGVESLVNFMQEFEKENK